jgi:hypothetical protein
MKPRPTPRVLAVVAATLFFTLFAVNGYAQYQTGNIYGKAQAKDGSVLPGVTVTITGLGAPQTTVTDALGTFRFINLAPGSYSLKAELSGYGTATRTGIGVNVGRNSDVSMTLNPAVAESITVTAEAPLLDVRKAGTSTNVTRVELDKIPQSRDPWTVLQSVPSVMVDRINVGGNQSGQQSNYIAKGALGRENTWNMDGVTITDMAATGASPMYFDFDSFEEMLITTGGSDPRVQTAGVQLNMVTKRGTNDFRGSGRYFYTPGSMQADSTVPGEASGYLAAANRINFVRDYGAEVGGPIWKDKFWFWGARGDQKISVQVASTVGTNAAVTAGLFDNIVLRNKNLKLNGQIASSNSAVAFYTFSDKVRNARNLSPSRPLETTWLQTGPTPVYKLEDTQIIGSSLYLTAMWSKVQGGFNLIGNGGEGESAPPMWRDTGRIFHGNFYTEHIIRPQKQYRLDGSKFFDLGKMNHELKFGFGYRNTPVSTTITWPGPNHAWWDFATPGASTCTAQGLPSNCGLAIVARDTWASAPLTIKYNDFYVGDTILMGNLTVQGGLRVDRQQSRNLGASVGANPMLATPLTLPCISTITCTGGSLNASLPGLTYAGDSRAFKWNTVAPRIGGTYTLGADKRTLIRAGYNRYVSQMSATVSGVNPVSYSYFYFYGVDANGDHAIQKSELAKIAGFRRVNPNDPTALTTTTRIDYGMKVPTTDEFIIGGERELMTDFSVGLNYTYRKNNDFVATRPEKTQGAGDYYTTADYVPATKSGVPVVAGGTFTLKDPITGAVITTFTTSTRPVFALSPSVPTVVYNVITTRPGYSQKFSGFELTATKRMSHNWMVRANASWNDYTEDCGGKGAANGNPTQTIGACPGGQVAPSSGGSGAFGGAFINAKWEANVSGVYVAPWDINIGASLSARQGYPAPLRDTVTGLRGGSLTVVLDPVGDKRFENVYELDMRVAKDFRFFNRVGMTISGDLFNVPNQRTILQRNSTVLQNEASLSSGWRITELQTPRIWRLGARFNF